MKRMTKKWICYAAARITVLEQTMYRKGSHNLSKLKFQMEIPEPTNLETILPDARYTQDNVIFLQNHSIEATVVKARKL